MHKFIYNLLFLTSLFSVCAEAQFQASAGMIDNASASSAGKKTMVLKPGMDIRTLVHTKRASTAGTQYVFSPGLYRMVEMVPQDNDSFVANGTVILSGAELLTNFKRSGNLYYVDGQTQQGQLNGSCLNSHPMCAYPEDLYFDDVPLLRVSSLSKVSAGSWFFDYNDARIYFFDNPNGHVVETSSARSAFSGQAKNVTVKGFIVEKYAIPAQMGAIGDQSPGPNWKVSNNEVRWNHGTGIQAGSGTSVTYNYVHDNGQKGLGGSGDNLDIEHNEIAFNNVWGGFNPGWEAGGTKFSGTHNLVVKYNVSHDNVGAGLWTDIDNFGALYDSNTSYNNTGAGIQHEISWNAIIRNNTVYNNGTGQSVWLWGAQIAIQNSSNVEAYGNKITVPATYGNGIAIIFQNRGSGPNGQYRSAGNYVHNNDITYQGTRGSSGMAVDYDPADAYTWGNHFDSNVYHVSDPKSYHWNWRGNQNWTGMLASGQEGHGSMNLDVTPSAAVR